MTEQWRWACPHGHRDVRTETGPSGTYRCRTCRRRYHGDPVDLVREDLPDDPPPRHGGIDRSEVRR